MPNPTWPGAPTYNPYSELMPHDPVQYPETTGDWEPSPYRDTIRSLYKEFVDRQDFKRANNYLCYGYVNLQGNRLIWVSGDNFAPLYACITTGYSTIYIKGTPYTMAAVASNNELYLTAPAGFGLNLPYWVMQPA